MYELADIYSSQRVNLIKHNNTLSTTGILDVPQVYLMYHRYTCVSQVYLMYHRYT